MGKPGPKPLVELYLRKVKTKYDGNLYLVVYSTGRRTPRDFYRHIRRLEELGLIEKVSSGVIMCKGSKALDVTMMLMKKYSFKTKVFKVGEVR